MAKFVKTNSEGKIEICIRKSHYEKPGQHYGTLRKYPQDTKSQFRRFTKEISPDPWVKVIFNNGADFEYDWIVQELQKAACGSRSDDTSSVTAFNYRTWNNSAILFVRLTDPRNPIDLGSFRNNCRKIPHPRTGEPCDVKLISVDSPETPPSLSSPSSSSLKWVDALKEALSQRYNASERSLDLSRFTEDRTLLNQGLWLPVNRSPVVRQITALLQSIDEGRFQLDSLNLSSNAIGHTSHLIGLFESVPIRRLDLRDNRLVPKSLLRTLAGARHLTELVCDEEAIVSRGRSALSQARSSVLQYQSSLHDNANEDNSNQSSPSSSLPMTTGLLSSFMSELLEFCPTLERFNGKPVTKIAAVARRKTGLDPLLSLLPTTTTTGSNRLLLDFFLGHAKKLEQSWNGVDSRCRDQLIDYYSSDSVLTLSACYHDMSMNNRRLSEVYLRTNRNLARLKDEARLQQLVKRGSAQILGFLSDVPRLRHVEESFTVDTIADDERSKIFVVNGVFVECLRIPNHRSAGNNGPSSESSSPYTLINNSSANGTTGGAKSAGGDGPGGGGTHHNIFNMRVFSRAMIVVPPGKILQENWTITNPTDVLFRKYRDRFEEIKSAFDSEKKCREDLANTNSVSTSSAAATTVGAIGHNSNQQQNQQTPDTVALVESFSQFSKMNHFYSLQCLQESDWNVDKAKEIFQMALNNGTIPEEAFRI